MLFAFQVHDVVSVSTIEIAHARATKERHSVSNAK